MIARLRDLGRSIAEAIAARPALALLVALALPAFFVVTDVAILVYGNYRLGFDALLYSLGSQALLTGGDPWAVSLGEVVLAGPPSSVLAYTVTAWLPPDAAALVWVAAALGAATWALRRLGLALTWLLFPPLFVAIWNGSLDAFLPAAFIAAPIVAPFLKPYAVAGLIAERKWRSIVWAALLIVPTLPLVPQWLAHDPGAVIASQSPNLSAWGRPLLLVLTVPALISLGWRRGWYYAVPALWPSALLHYAAMTMPAIRPVAALGFCTPIGVIAEAVVDRARTLPAMPTSAQTGPRPRSGLRSLTVVLPAYNEAKRLGPALDELFGYLDGPTPEGVHPRIDVLVVDDGSTDGTADLVLSRAEASRAIDGDEARLELLRVKHAGKGSAVRSGMLAAAGDLVVFADADMATPPAELPKLVAALEANDVALGSRIQPDGTDMRATQPRYRRLLGWAFHALASVWVVGDVKDTQCGFKGFTREAAQDLFALQRITSIVFDVELIHLARRRGYRIAVVPIRWEDVRGSRMRPSAKLAVQVAWDLFRIPLLHRSVRKRR